MDSQYVRICFGLPGRVHNFLLEVHRIERKPSGGGKQIYGMERKTSQKKVNVAGKKDELALKQWLEEYNRARSTQSLFRFLFCTNRKSLENKTDLGLNPN